MRQAFEHSPKHIESRSEMLAQQSEHIGDTLRIFADKKLMSDRAADVTRFQVLIDTIRSDAASKEERHALSNQVLDYLTDPQSPVSSDEVEYMLALWSDMSAIDAAASHYLSRLEEHGTDKSQVVLEKLHGNEPITEEDWHDIRIGVDIPAIAALSSEVNVESILARSALLLDRVASATEYGNELLRDIIEIETFHAPLLYLLGLPAWEAILKHHTERARIMATGNQEKIAVYNRTSEYIGQVRESGLHNVVLQDVLGVPNIEDDQFSFIANNAETPYGSKSYFSAIRIGEAEDQHDRMRIISRIKSPGSCAHKQLHNEKYKNTLPQDIFASTVITSTIEEMTAKFKEVYAAIQASSQCELTSAASKKAPIHVKGAEAYRGEVMDGLKDTFGEEEFDLAKVDENESEPFQVLKITFTIRSEEGMELPAEIQFQTRKDRNASRLGGASHLCSKDKDSNGLPHHVSEGANQKAVNDRKWMKQAVNGRERMMGANTKNSDSIYIADDAVARERQQQRMRQLETTLIEASSDEFLLTA